MKDRQVEKGQPQSQFVFKDGEFQSKLGRSQRNVKKYEERKARRLAARGTLTFSSGK